MLRRYGAGHVGTAVENELHALLRGDVLHDDLQIREVRVQGLQGRFHKRGFAIENVDGGIGRLAVDAQRHVQFRHFALQVTECEHGNQHGIHVMDVRHSLIAVRGSTRRVVLARIHNAAFTRLDNLFRRCAIGEVAT